VRLRKSLAESVLRCRSPFISKELIANLGHGFQTRSRPYNANMRDLAARSQKACHNFLLLLVVNL
jgi:hypothetical protein